MNKLIDATLNNPLFITTIILVAWFLPGIILRNLAKHKNNERAKALQEQKIAKLYPKVK